MKLYEVWTNCVNDESENRRLGQFSTLSKARKYLKVNQEEETNPDRTYSLYIRAIE